METIFIDTTALYAYFSQVDNKHSIAISTFKQIDNPLVTTDYVIDETITLISQKSGAHLAYEVGDNLLKEHFAKIIKVSLDDAREALEILNKYSDKRFSFTDCVSFAIMERAKLKTAFSFDEHFKQYGRFIVIP